MTTENQTIPQNTSERRYSFASLSIAFLIIVILIVPSVIITFGMVYLMLTVGDMYRFYDVHLSPVTGTLSHVVVSYWYLGLGLIILMSPLALWWLAKLSTRTLTLILVFSLGVIVGATAVFVPLFVYLLPLMKITWDLAP
jgi:hypothetical protein